MLFNTWLYHRASTIEIANNETCDNIQEDSSLPLKINERRISSGDFFPCKIICPLFPKMIKFIVIKNNQFFHMHSHCFKIMKESILWHHKCCHIRPKFDTHVSFNQLKIIYKK